MNFLGCGHRKKTYGNNLFKKIAYQRLYFHPPSFVYMKDIFLCTKEGGFFMPKVRKEIPELEKLVQVGRKKFVRYEEGAQLYSMGLHTFQELAKDAKAVYHVKRVVLVNTEIP